MNKAAITCGNACNFLLLLLILQLLVPACSPVSVTDECKSLPAKSWKIGDTLGFPCLITDTLQPYDLYISLRHNNDYPYRNLFLFVDTYFPQGKISRDTLEFILARPDGTWLGKGFSKIKYSQFLIRRGVIFPEAGEYRFVFQHAMRVDDLAGLRDLGVKIAPSGNTRTRP